MTHELRLEREFDAPAETVFDTFLDPEAQRILFADGPNWIVEADVDLRVGGTWTLVFGPSRGELFREVAVFSKIERPRHLAYELTATFSDGRTFDTQVDITFEESDGRTRMTLVQSGYPTAKMRDYFRRGWSDILGGLGGIVGKRG